MDQRLWKCVNRYRVRTEVDYILEDAMPCRAEVEGTICYSHIAGPVEGDELKELNDNRRAKEMSTINQTFCALSLYDARLVGEENEKNSMFRKFLYERIRMHEGRGQQYDNMLHLLFWHFGEDLKVCDENGDTPHFHDEDLIGRRVRIVVKRFPKVFYPGYALESVVLLAEEAVKVSNADKKREVMRQVISNNKEISQLLKTNMEILLENDLRSSEHDPYFDKEEDKIIFPKGYIKHKAEYEEIYQLKSIIKNEDIRSNAEYCLQMSDVYCFLDNYFHTYGSVNMAIKKAAVVNLVGVMEAMIFCVVGEVRERCEGCKNERCKYRFPKKKNSLWDRISQMQKVNLLGWEDKDYEFMVQSVKLRNRIHLASANGEEVKNDMRDYAEQFDKLHGELIGFLEKLSDALCEKVCPGAKECLKEYTEKSSEH